MKKKMGMLGIALLAVTMTFTAAPAFANDTVIDKMGDWFATVGKPQSEKDQILVQRHMDRAAKKTGDSFNQAGKDLQKAFK